MNRVVLAGRLAARPRIAYTPGGVPVAEFRLLVPPDTCQRSRQPPIEIECVASGETAENLNLWGEADHRVNLEGRLRPDNPPAGRAPARLRVHCDRAYFVDPVADAPANLLPTGNGTRTADPAQAANRSLPAPDAACR